MVHPYPSPVSWSPVVLRFCPTPLALPQCLASQRQGHEEVGREGGNGVGKAGRSYLRVAGAVAARGAHAAGASVSPAERKNIEKTPKSPTRLFSMHPGGQGWIRVQGNCREGVALRPKTLGWL